MSARETVVTRVADEVLAQASSAVLRVAVDGVDGAGKTFFADQLGDLLTARGASVIRASVDGFHHPRDVRYRRGRSSPEGFFRDSYDYASLNRVLLDPLGPGGNRRFRRAVYDVVTEEPVEARWESADPGAVLVLDGIFLHRSELRAYWDYSVFLDVRFDVSVPRGAQRGDMSPDPASTSNRRYVEGQWLYLAECTPRAHASIVIDNNDLSVPFVVS